MSVTTYLIRMLPLTLMRRKIKNIYIRSFLHYVPYVTLTVMTFPDILKVTDNWISGMAAMAAGVILAWKGASLLKVAIACCITLYIVELFF